MMVSLENHYRNLEIEVPEGISSERIDRYLALHPEVNLSRTRVQKLIYDGLVLVNDETVSKKHLLRVGDTISITIPPPAKSDIKAEDIPINIVFEDEFLAVVDKPAGMVTHPGAGNYSGTLVNAMMYHFERLANSSSPDRPGIVHRLDKETSGLLIIAKKDDVYQRLQEAIQKREVKRTYLALVCGHLPDEIGEIDLPVGRSKKDRKKMGVTGEGRQAVTLYRRKERYRSYDLLEVNLETGRTHQIRVHFSHLGHPVFGDPEYGGREKQLKGLFAPERKLAKQMLDVIERQALHARQLEFIHPVTSKRISLTSDLPGDFKELLALLNREGL